MKVTVEEYDLIIDGDMEGFSTVEDEGWQVEHKYESKRVIVKHEDSGNYYALYQSRSGSYFSHYEYDEVDTDKDGLATLEQVFPHERTIIEYI